MSMARVNAGGWWTLSGAAVLLLLVTWLATTEHQVIIEGVILESGPSGVAVRIDGRGTNFLRSGQWITVEGQQRQLRSITVSPRVLRMSPSPSTSCTPAGAGPSECNVSLSVGTHVSISARESYLQLIASEFVRG